MKHLLFLGMFFAGFYISHSIPEFCKLPADQGEGPHFFFALHYNYTADMCTPFLYKGQGGNENRFQNERECIKNCSANAEMIYPTDVIKACHLKKAPGGCSGNFLRYYYDSIHNKCKKFIWTGCFGNGNRFFDQTTCNSTCAGVHDDGDELEEDEPDTPIAIICGVLLAAIASSILITVMVLTIKSKNKKKAQGKRDHKSDAPLRDPPIEME